MVKVKRKGLKTDCRGNIRTIRTNVCDHSLGARDNHALIHMMAKTAAFDKIIDKCYSNDAGQTGVFAMFATYVGGSTFMNILQYLCVSIERNQYEKLSPALKMPGIVGYL